MPQYVRQRGIRGLGDGDTQTVTDAQGNTYVIPIPTTGVVVQPTATGQTTSYYSIVGGTATPIGTPTTTFSLSAIPTWGWVVAAGFGVLLLVKTLR
jgi:hypothetical protein